MTLLWDCQDIEQIAALINALPTTADKHDALSLVQIATWETLEQEQGFSKEVQNVAKAAIDHAQR